VLRLDKTLTLTEAQVSTEDYPAFREFLGAAFQAEQEQVVFRTAGG
jgi:hypothetical protein